MAFFNEQPDGSIATAAYVEITPGRFKSAGDLVNFDRHDDSIIVICKTCDARWTAQSGNTGKPRKNWWKCPNRCYQ